MHTHMSKPAIAAILALLAGSAFAKLPPPTPEQQQAAAAKKEQAAAQAEQEKQKLSESMDKVTSRWRARASENGWKAERPAEGATPKGAQPSPSQIRSEKLGTAQPSTDVKASEKQGPPDKIK